MLQIDQRTSTDLAVWPQPRHPPHTPRGETRASAYGPAAVRGGTHGRAGGAALRVGLDAGNRATQGTNSCLQRVSNF
jgi:hypothetical protein